jgi:LacI family transcriptional regulator
MASVTITDVARRAGVSMKTVSRVMNAEPHVREQVRERVIRAARELSYRPKVSARSLAGARSYQLGFLLNLVSPYAMHAELGALRACREAGYHLMIETFDMASKELASDLDAMVNSLSVDGMILLPPVSDNAVVLAAFEAAGIPVVRVAPETQRPGLMIEVQDEAAARTITEHLLDLGHQRIGMVQGPAGHAASTRRLSGYRKALAARGIEPDPELIQPGNFFFEGGQAAAERLLKLKSPPTAVFGGNDSSALGVMAKAQELGLKVPKDLSVAGFDDIASASMVWPGLTTMRQPMADMGAAAAEAIISLASKSEADRRPAFACELVVRGSTAPPRA